MFLCAPVTGFTCPHAEIRDVRLVEAHVYTRVDRLCCDDIYGDMAFRYATSPRTRLCQIRFYILYRLRCDYLCFHYVSSCSYLAIPAHHGPSASNFHPVPSSRLFPVKWQSLLDHQRRGLTIFGLGSNLAMVLASFRVSWTVEREGGGSLLAGLELLPCRGVPGSVPNSGIQSSSSTSRWTLAGIPH